LKHLLCGFAALRLCEKYIERRDAKAQRFSTIILNLPLCLCGFAVNFFPIKKAGFLEGNRL
jgi:hypothetical protein